MAVSMIGLIVGLILLTILAIRGVNLFLAAPICALIVAYSGGILIFDSEGNDNFVQGYMDGFSGFIGAWFFVFLLGSLFGKLMERTGAAKSVAGWVMLLLGEQHAVLAVVGACAILSYCGVSVFVVAFSVYPMAFSLFKSANIPHRFIPAAIAFGSGTFTMTSAGSQEIQNWIPTKYLGTTPYAAWEASLVAAIFIAFSGFFLLKYMIKKSEERGEVFTGVTLQGPSNELVAEEDGSSSRGLPHPATALIPLVIVLLTSFFTHKTLYENALIVALLAGCVSLAIINYKYIVDASKIVSEGALGALIAISNTAAVVGFGTVVKLSPAFAGVVAMVTSSDVSSLIVAAGAITIVAGITGSASGGQTIVLPEVAPHFLESGMNPEHLHRVTALSSGVLDSLPHNGFAITLIRVICRETHRTAYLPMAVLTVIVPALATVLAIMVMTFQT